MKWVRKQVGAKVNFFRVDIATEVGKTIMAEYNIPLNSANVIFDARGKEIWRSFAIPPNGKKAVRILNSLLQPEKSGVSQA
ncbi:MAG: hypothetical protein ACE5IR_13545 [bacterium]